MREGIPTAAVESIVSAAHLSRAELAQALSILERTYARGEIWEATLIVCNSPRLDDRRRNIAAICGPDLARSKESISVR
jgi:hypothetical protein